MCVACMGKSENYFVKLVHSIQAHMSRMYQNPEHRTGKVVQLVKNKTKQNKTRQDKTRHLLPSLMT